LFGDGRVRFRRLHEHRSTEAEQRLAVDRELVALRVTAEIIVIVENQDARVGVDVAAIEICGCQPADACANDNEVVVFARWPGRPVLALHHGVCRFERPGVRTTHAHFGWRIVRRLLACNRIPVFRAGGYERCTDRDADSV
jgi:hypothetical protein